MIRLAFHFAVIIAACVVIFCLWALHAPDAIKFKRRSDPAISRPNRSRHRCRHKCELCR